VRSSGSSGQTAPVKATAIPILTTILEPTRGSFSVAGVPHTNPAEIRRRMGVVRESAGYPERQTGEEFLRYHATHVSSDTPARALVSSRADLLEAVGLAERGGSLIGTFSRGMRQRLGIARALVNDPEVVVLDQRFSRPNEAV
jgi:ABC-2 type transport system ATP-binding protein